MRLSILGLIAFTIGLGLAQSQPRKNEEVPKIFLTAHYVYVEATDGGGLNPRVVPENRKAIADLQYALQDWKRYIVTAKRREADLFFVVRRGSLVSVQGRVGGRHRQNQSFRLQPKVTGGPLHRRIAGCWTGGVLCHTRAAKFPLSVTT
jgi:hypothetical protein